jgi:hypothetical protein
MKLHFYTLASFVFAVGVPDQSPMLKFRMSISSMN